MSSEVAEAQEEGAHMPSLSSKSREHGELQDMYRRTLAASWAASPGQPRADDCIEDIFSGGDGWGGSRSNNGTSRATTPTQSRINLGLRDDSDEDHMSRDSSVTNLSGVFSSGRKSKWGSPSRKVPSSRNSPGNFGRHDLREKLSSGALKSGGVAGRASLEQSVRKMERAGGTLGNGGPRPYEIDEFNNPYKEDLRSWRIRGAAS